VGADDPGRSIDDLERELARWLFYNRQADARLAGAPPGEQWPGSLRHAFVTGFR
jgi:hypothetical protein